MAKKKAKLGRARKTNPKKSQPSAEQTAGEALFVIPARLTRPFFTQLYAACEEKIFAHFKEQIRPVVRAVSSVGDQFNANEVTRILEREFRMNPGRIKFLIVVPTGSKGLSGGVFQVAQEHSVPVIALTLPFCNWPKENNSRKNAPPCILCNSAEGTRKLAGTAALELRKKGIGGIDRPAHLWVLPGAKRIDSAWRVWGFLDGLKAEGIELADRKAQRLDSAKWLRPNARKIVSEAIVTHEQAAQERGEDPRPVDVIFCANDELALGARDAIRDAIQESSGNRTQSVTAQCLIFGFDAIVEARSLIEEYKGDKWLKGTVEQRLPLMADNLVALMEKIRAGKNHSPFVEVPPKVVIHPKAEQEVAASDIFPDDVPSLTKDGFLSESDYANERGVEKETLRRYRVKGSTDNDDFGEIGKDSQGVVYRVDEADGIKKIWYLKGSVTKRIDGRRGKKSS